MLNAITIDLEDYYQVTAFDHIIDRQNWDNIETRIQQNLEKVLSILDDYKVKATFFVLGWIAEKNPELIKKISKSGKYWNVLNCVCATELQLFFLLLSGFRERVAKV